MDWVAWSVWQSVFQSVCHSSEPCKNGWSDQDAVWVIDSVGPKEAVLDGAQILHAKGQLLGERTVHGMPVGTSAKMAELIDLPGGF